MEEYGSQNYLVEIGGEIRGAGLRPDGAPWRIGIEPPDEGLNISYIVMIGNEAVATSGDYRNFYELNGARISHTIDPASGRPVDNNMASVSVITPSAMQADALATLYMVIGPRAAYKSAMENDIPVLIFTREADGLGTLSTPAFARYLLEK